MPTIAPMHMPMPEQPGQVTAHPRRTTAMVFGVAALATALLGGAWWIQRTQPTAPAQVPRTVDQGTGGTVSAAAPSMEEGAALLAATPVNAEHAAAMAKLLARDGMLTTLVAAVAMVADGESPAPVLAFLEVPGRFTVVEQPARSTPAQEPRAFVDPKSHARFNGLTALFTSVGAQDAGARYRLLRPYLQAAYDVIAPRGARFDDALARGIQRLTAVKLQAEPVELERHALVYRYKDPALEALTPAEKQLLRMGPHNGRIIQEHLLKFAAAAGLPTSL